jgi:hypothetical protein
MFRDQGTIHSLQRLRRAQLFPCTAAPPWGTLEAMTRRKPAQSENIMQNQGIVDRPTAGLDRGIQTRIGQQLRAMYDDVVKEGVPDRFADLLKRLDPPSDESSS